MLRGHLVARLIYAAAQLGLPDQLASGPKSAAALAVPLGAHPPSLHRFRRALASLGILTEREGETFALTRLGETLVGDSVGSLKATALFFGNPAALRGWDDLIYSLRTGKTGFEKANGLRFFDYLAKNPEAASIFSQTMVGYHGDEPPAVAAAYDFSSANVIVDVGGATGNLISTILRRYEEPRAILFDRAHGVADAPRLLASQGVGHRVTIETGDFFQTAPAGGDIYILSHILHDWNDEECLTILGRVRKVMKPHGRLLLVEMIPPAGDAPHQSKMLDMAMLVLLGGQERTETEYAALLKKAGFRLTRVVPTETATSVVEAAVAA
jgi:O-methyltransferase domain/Dimerisation domain